MYRSTSADRSAAGTVAGDGDGDGDTVRVIVGVGVADKVGHAVTVLRGRYASMQLRVNVENFAANAAGTVPVSQLLDTSKVLSHHQHR